jgi:predicted amidohydrolase
VAGLLVAAAQLGPASPDRAGTVARMVDLIEAAGGVQLLVFPELSLSPYFAASVSSDVLGFAEPSFPSATTSPLVAAIVRAGLTAVVPFAELTSDGLYNSSVVVGPDGSILGRYRKMHIPGTTEPIEDRPFQILEKRYFRPGDLGFGVHPTPAGRVGTAICYDRRFPETYRCLALGGAEVLAIVFNTPYDRSEPGAQARAVEAHELAVRAGAVANGLPTIAAGKAGLEGELAFVGASSVISHTGEVLARASSDGDELVAAEIDLDAAAAERARYDNRANRRPDQYALLTEVAS